MVCLRKTAALLLVGWLLISLPGCSNAPEPGRQTPAPETNTESATPSPTPEIPDERGLLPLYLDSEEQLAEVVQRVKRRDPEESVIDVPSAFLSGQTYIPEEDIQRLAELTEFYAPQKELPGTSFAYIAVKAEYVMFHYAQTGKETELIFTWHRNLAPEAAKNNWYGGTTTRYKEGHGFRENLMEGKVVSYFIWWVESGRVYTASIPVGYTDEEMLDFCRARTVSCGE